MANHDPLKTQHLLPFDHLSIDRNRKLSAVRPLAQKRTHDAAALRERELSRWDVPDDDEPTDAAALPHLQNGQT